MKSKTNKKLFGIFLVATIFLISFAAAADANYCCEKTTSGAWCQNAPQAQCDTGFKTAPTSCDSTSYCKKGCCFDGNEGLCMEGTPQRVCKDSNGTWADNANCDVPQCNLGCCILADQGAFVTLTRCKQMSGFYGLKTDFRTTITDELTCIQTAQGADKGACVFEDPALLKKSCIFTTRANCNTANLASDSGENVSLNSTTGASSGFYKDYLCTAPELGTECAPDLKNTVLISGKDEVYFQDTCGNTANIYDASKAKDNAYWTKVVTKENSCGAGLPNSGSTTCGNCDYYLGSIGKKANGLLGIGQPAYGSYICSDLNCKTQNKKHGESWCANDGSSGSGGDTVGSRYYREICIDNEIITEPCSDYRNEICMEDTFNGFSEAQCRVNRWEDCTQQKQKTDCENYLARDCRWQAGYYFSNTTGQIEKSVNLSSVANAYCSTAIKTACASDSDSATCITGIANCNPPLASLTPNGLCLPNYPPGFNFWGTTTTGTGDFNATTSAFGTGYVSPTTNTVGAAAQCALGNVNVVIEWNQTKRPADFFNLYGQKSAWTCGNDACSRYVGTANAYLAALSTDNVKAISKDMNNICTSLGDCGGKKNWAGEYTDYGYAAYLNNVRVAGSGGSSIQEAVASTSSSTSTSTSTTGTTSTSGTTSSASSLSSLTSLINSGSNLASTVSGSSGSSSGTAKAIADIPSERPLQFKIIIDYFKNKLGLGTN